MSASASQSDLPEQSAVSTAGGLPWLFSPTVDLAAFLGSAIASLILLVVGAQAGLLHGESPQWTWITTVLLVDVAHVYATGFRVYFDPVAFRRHRWPAILTPALCFVIGWSVYSESSQLFWTLLAYLAVFHFVRQQYGWVAMYRAKASESSVFARRLDTAAIYLATIYPLVWWHAHLPRSFWWMLTDDFVPGIPVIVAELLAPVYWMTLLAYFAFNLHRGLTAGQWNPGKDIVVLTTAVCWYVGIITFNSDYAFTVTNVVIHGVPYFVIIYWYRTPIEVSKSAIADTQARSDSPAGAQRLQASTSRVSRSIPRVLRFMATLWLLAYAEELLWDRGVWHERGWLFGAAWHSERLQAVLVPLLAVPQLTHYVLDGFIWKRRSNPDLTEHLKAR